MKEKCDRDCFHCPHEDCIEDGMTLEDYRASRELLEYIDPELAKRRKHSAAAARKYYQAHKAERAAYHAKYYAEHREELRAYKAAYYRAHKAECAANRAAYYAAHKEEIHAQQAAYRAAHRKEYAAYMAKYYANLRQRFSGFGLRLRDVRSAAGYTQSTLAEALGCSRHTVSHLETGRADPARWPRLFDLLPELRKEERT